MRCHPILLPQKKIYNMATKDISVIRDKKTGDIKNIRDKGIKDAKAKTAVAQTDAVRMKTVDDKEVYIDRNSLVQAIAEVMNSNSQSTIQTLFGADANGNHANINMANLASVLSVPTYQGYVSSTTDIDTIKDGLYVVSSSPSSQPSCIPGILIKLTIGERGVMINFQGYGSTGATRFKAFAVRARYGNSWQGTVWRTYKCSDET